MTLGTIYALAEPNTGDIRYCGKTVEPMSHRMSGHRADVRRQSHRHLYRWLGKLYEVGQEPTVMVCEEIDLTNMDRAEQLRVLNEAETRWIIQLKALGFRLTNATDGGDGCHGRMVSAETRARTAASNLGQKRSAEACANIRAAALKRPKSCYVRGEAHPHYGKTQLWKDPEARVQRIREAWNDRKKLEHGLRGSGEANGNHKITAEIALAIYSDTRAYREIAADHNTNIKMISDIKNGISWRRVTKHDPAERRTKYKINDQVAKDIYLADGSQRSIASRFGVSKACVADVKSGRSWRHVTHNLNV